MDAINRKKTDFLNLSKEILNRKGIVRIPIIGSSMYPLIRKGDTIFIEPVDIEHTALGDILVYQRGKRMVAHRLIKKYTRNGRLILVTKGDTFSECDEPFFSKDVLGRVAAIGRKGRYLSIDNGLCAAVNFFSAKISPFSKWIYPPLRRIKQSIDKREAEMRTEDLLIRLCAKLNSDPKATQSTREVLSPGLNWAYFFERARSEGVLPLVYKSLFEINAVKSIVPEDTWLKLESSYYTVAARNISLCEKLNTILSSFNQAGIEVILLKGMALIHTIYSNIVLRPMYDIDILIRKKDFALVAEKLKELGYINSSHYPEDFHKDNMMVDVHWELINITRIKSRKKSYSIDLDEVWKSSIPIEISGQRARILSPEYCLMDLCLHLVFHHGLQGLIWFIDIVQFIEYYKNEIDWHKFIEKSREYKIYKPIYYVLFYVKKILGGDIPQFVLDRLKPARQGFLERRIFDLILSGLSIENIRFFFTFLTMQNFLDRLVFLKEIILPSPKVLSARYNISSTRYLPQHYLIHFKSVMSSGLKLLKSISFAS